MLKEERKRVWSTTFDKLHIANKTPKEYFESLRNLFPTLTGVYWKENENTVFAVLRFDPAMRLKTLKNRIFEEIDFEATDIAEIPDLLLMDFIGEKKFTESSIEAQKFRNCGKNSLHQEKKKKKKEIPDDLEIIYEKKNFDVEKVIGRNSERESLQEFFSFPLSKTLYVSGCSGSGKTLCVKTTLNELNADRIIYVDVLCFQNIENCLWKFLYEKLFQTSGTCDFERLLKIFSNQKFKEEIILVFDNIDIIEISNAKIFYNLCELQSLCENLKLVFIGIKINYFQNFPANITSRLKLTEIVFVCYSKFDFMEFGLMKKEYSLLSNDKILEIAAFTAQTSGNLRDFYSNLNKQENELVIQREFKDCIYEESSSNEDKEEIVEKEIIAKPKVIVIENKKVDFVTENFKSKLIHVKPNNNHVKSCLTDFQMKFFDELLIYSQNNDFRFKVSKIQDLFKQKFKLSEEETLFYIIEFYESGLLRKFETFKKEFYKQAAIMKNKIKGSVPANYIFEINQMCFTSEKCSCGF